MTQPHLKESIDALAKSHPVPAQDKLERRMKRMERMVRFYKDKAPDAPEKQGRMFSEFVSALMYATTIIKLYRQLTRNLKSLAEEARDENRTDSESR